MPHTKQETPEWTPVETPFETDLFAVDRTVDGAYAVGANGTVVANPGDGWSVQAEVEAEQQAEWTMDVTQDGTRIWVASTAGVVAAYDVEEGQTHTFAYSGEAKATWQTVAVSGEAGTEHVLLANDAGAIVPAQAEGQKLTFKQPVTPGDGASIAVMAFAAHDVAYAVDTSGKAYKSTGPETWDPIGTVNADTEFLDIFATVDGRVYVAARDGHLYQHDKGAERWTSTKVASSALVAVDVFQGQIAVLTATATIYVRAVTGQEQWTKQPVPTETTLRDLALGYPDVAVGKAGTVLRRAPARQPKPPEPPEEKQPKPPEPPEEPKPPEPVVSCEVLVRELLDRLTREELVELIEVRTGCESGIVEHLKTKEEQKREDIDVALLPVLEEELAARREETRHRREREHRRTGRAELEALLERLRTC